MNDNRLLAELVESRVEKRMAQVKRFGVHMVASVALTLLVILGASQDWLPPAATIILVLGTMFSLLLHGTWLSFGAARAAIIKEEIARVQQMYPELAGLSLEAEKPKRDDSALAEETEDEPIDLELLADEEERRRIS